MDTMLKLASEFKTGQLADYLLEHKLATIHFMERPNQKRKHHLRKYQLHNLRVLSLLNKYGISKAAYLDALRITATSTAWLIELQLHKERDAVELVDCLHEECSFLYTDELVPTLMM